MKTLLVNLANKMKKNPYLGKFIVFEGLDGSGQSTQAAKLLEYFNEKKQTFRFGRVGAHLTKEPTSGIIGGLIRGQLSFDWKSSQECLQLLFAADRSYHLEKEIMPLLKKGVTVICDRYFFSSCAFGALELDQEWLLKVNENFLSPDLIFLLEVPPEICVDRIKRSRFAINLFEKEEILRKVWTQYQKLARKNKNTYIINGERSIDEIFEDIKQIVNKKFSLKR